MDDNLYAYVMRGELTKVALEKTPIVSKHSSSEMLAQEYVECLALDLLDDEKVNAANLWQRYILQLQLLKTLLGNL